MFGFPPSPTVSFPINGDGHWYLALDYSIAGATLEPCVSYIDLASEVDRVVAKDFSAFLDMLVEGLGEHTFELVGVSLKEPESVTSY